GMLYSSRNKGIFKVLYLRCFIIFLKNRYDIKTGWYTFHLSFIHPGLSRFIHIFLLFLVYVLFRLSILVIRPGFYFLKINLRVLIKSYDIYLCMFKMVITIYYGIVLGFH